MRTKTAILTAALVAAGALSSMAQNVYSVNVVGYVNVTLNSNKFTMISNPLQGTDMSVGTLFPANCAGIQLLKWTGGGFSFNNFDPDFGWDDPTALLAPGDGAFIKNPYNTNIVVTFVGTVLQGTNTVNLHSGFQIVSSKVPQAGLLQTDLGYVPTGGDAILKWTGGGYGFYNFDPDFGWDTEPPITVGEAFFVNTPAAHPWTRVFTVQ